MLTPKEIINGLKPCSYRYNEIKDLGDKINFGFLAQDILDTFGDEYNFVSKEKKGEYYQVNYLQFIAPLVSVLKEQQSEINLLKEEIKILRTKL
ncbi:tail fiber domain-containing protein [Peredibacter sp. HCB2-198]|uniref:tail fiber domain-containing protein n=1 Tax=Peredibacter sp. HCB2-198 TaxID=3383025 RepID=UPI0038B4BC91